MAKVTIVIEDVSEDGSDGILADIKFDPEIEKGKERTMAQELGVALAEFIFDVSNETVILEYGEQTGVH